MKKYSIQNMYSDALYWATSTQSKDKGYHTTRTLEAILRKLIHYSRKNEKITYSNSIIAQHTFMGEETIRKGIPKLTKIGFISTATFKISDNGEIKTRRTIFIKWDFIQTILDDVPKQEKTEEPKASGDTSSIEKIQEEIETPKPQELELQSNDSNQNIKIKELFDNDQNSVDTQDIVELEKKISFKELISISLEGNTELSNRIYDYLKEPYSRNPLPEMMTPQEFIDLITKKRHSLKSLSKFTISIEAMINAIKEQYLTPIAC